MEPVTVTALFSSVTSRTGSNLGATVTLELVGLSPADIQKLHTLLNDTTTGKTLVIANHLKAK